VINTDETNNVQKAVNAVKNGQTAFCKFLSANDTGLTGAHQSGIYIPQASYSILFDQPGEKGSNKKKVVSIKWPDGGETESVFTYYGQKTRNEYRITRFGRNFEFLRPKYTGALFVLVKQKESEYTSFVLNSEEEIDEFLLRFSLSPASTNCLISVTPNLDFELNVEFRSFVSSLSVDFPTSTEMSEAARNIEEKVYDQKEWIVSAPDQKLIRWVCTEYSLFRAIEIDRYQAIIQKGFTKIEDFLDVAQTVLNRRKSRAGKSLEHHLSALFKGNGLTFEEQARTEGHKTPDFLFPSSAAYHNPTFPTDHLVTLAAKTTCKDRWRQILSEADRLRNGKKFLCTLQRGISPDQLSEMQTEQVILVVPKPYIVEFPRDFREQIWSLHKFIKFIKYIEST